MRLYFQCTYCGDAWSQMVYSKHVPSDLRCALCNDRHIQVKEVSIKKIDYYQGCPPFPEDLEEKSIEYYGF